MSPASEPVTVWHAQAPPPLLPFANSDALRMNMCAMAAFRSCTCVNSTMNSASVVYDGASSVVYWLPGMCACT